jgi:hypothetical protein
MQLRLSRTQENVDGLGCGMFLDCTLRSIQLECDVLVLEVSLSLVVLHVVVPECSGLSNLVFRAYCGVWMLWSCDDSLSTVLGTVKLVESTCSIIIVR